MPEPEIERLFESLRDAQRAAPAGRIALFNARAHPALAELKRSATVIAVQSFRPHWLALRDAGLAPLRSPDDLAEGERFHRIALFPDRNRLRTRFLIAAAIRRLADAPAPPALIACQANRHGARALESDLKQAGCTVRTDSRRKCRLMRCDAPAALEATPAAWQALGRMRRVESTGLFSQPGLFSWDRADPGSLLLLDTVPELAGCALDLCCGHGLLARRLAEAGHPVARWHLLDAEHLALDCARANMAETGAEARFHWLDAAADPLPASLAGRMDAVVCNPPFHRGHARDVALGARILRTGLQALRRGGRMFIVANRQLPYERELAAQAAAVRILRQEGGYKIIEAVR